MGKKASKASRKYAAKGQLKKAIQTRHKQQQIKKKLQSRRSAKGRGRKAEADDGGAEREHKEVKEQKSAKSMTVDKFLDAGFMEDEDVSGDDNVEADASSVSEGDDLSENGSVASIEDLEGEAHVTQLSELAKTDPEFYKYLLENDRELLEFDPSVDSYFRNVIGTLGQLTDNEMLKSAVAKSAKIVPWVVGSRRTLKQYLKECLKLWSSAEDSVRIASVLAFRKLASASDEFIVQQVFKGMYLTFVRSCKSSNAHNLPSINLMKNSASDVFCTNHAIAYQHAFRYIRQLAIHLRESMKVKTKEAYTQVYNWQYVHCVDFWSMVLVRACDEGQQSELKSLIYPLVQVSLGAIGLVSSTRSYPFHLHILRSLLHLTRHTDTYIPLAAYLLPIITSTLTPSSRPKPSTLPALDLEVVIRVPQQYLKTRICHEVLAEEAAYVLADWLSTPTVQGSVAFPELVVGIIVMLRKGLKAAKTAGTGGKEVGSLKTLVEKIEESAKWVEAQRRGVAFGPGKLDAVQDWEMSMRGRVKDSPLGKYVKQIGTMRAKRRALVEKARDGGVEVLEE